MQAEPRPDFDNESMPDELELALAPKVSALGERLRADADSIAARYPIDSSPAFGADFWALAREAMEGEVLSHSQPEQLVGRSRGRLAVVTSAAAAVVLCVALVGWRMSGLSSPSADDGLSAAIRQADIGAGNGAIAHGDLHSVQSGSEGESILRTNILQGLSGAEQEAVLDLLDRQSPPPASFSI